jgi:hypothetical protein
MGEIIINGDGFKGSLILSHTILNGLLYPPIIDFHEQANHFSRAANKFYCFSAALKFEKYIGARTMDQ